MVGNLSLVLVVDDYAERRMHQRGVNEGQVRYAINNPIDTFTHDEQTTYVSVLPDGTNIKVRTKEIVPEHIVSGVRVRVLEIVTAFTFTREA